MIQSQTLLFSTFPQAAQKHKLSPYSPGAGTLQYSTAEQFLHWMTPYGLNKLHSLSPLPPHNIAREHVILVHAVKPKTLSNYGVGLVRFTQFCDTFNIPEPMRMPAPEWLLSHFI